MLNDAQYEQLVAAWDDPMLRMYVTILGETGSRCNSEALHLGWEDVETGIDPVEGVRVQRRLSAMAVYTDHGGDRRPVHQRGHRTKSGKSRYVPMTESPTQFLVRGGSCIGKD